MGRGERFRVTTDLEVPVTSSFRIDSFSSIYYSYAVGFLLTAREHETALAGAIDLNLINNSALTLLISALGLEAHINAYGIRHLGKEYFDTIDRLSPPYKFRLVSDLLSNQKNWLPNHLFADLKLLFRIRDRLVHFKPLEADGAIQGAVRRTFFISRKELGVLCFERTVLKLQELAPADDVSWLKNISSSK